MVLVVWFEDLFKFVAGHFGPIRFLHDCFSIACGWCSAGSATQAMLV